MPDRRSFLRVSAFAAAGAVTLPTIWKKSVFAQSTGIPSALLSAASGAHAISTANSWAGIMNASDWSNLANAHYSILS